MDLDAYTTFTIGVLFMLLGKELNKRIRLLQEFNIPEPVTGGLIGAVMITLGYLTFSLEVTFDLDARDALILYFFTGIGLNASFASLISGGARLGILVGICVSYIFLQDYISVTIAKMLGMEPVAGLLAGSVSLIGGHGTTIAWSPTFIEQYGITNASEIGVACATAGLIIASLIGGPIAKLLINIFKLTPKKDENLYFGVVKEPAGEKKIDYFDLLGCWFIMNICIAIGVAFDEFLEDRGINLPTFVSCLFVAIIATNVIPPLSRKISFEVRWPSGGMSLGIISDIALGCFLAMSLMSLRLWELVDLAGPVLVLLVVQTVVALFIALFIVFPLMGRDYEAAVVSAGFGGISLGATPIAIANMQAVTERYGAAPRAFIIVPLVSAFILDLSNAVVIRLFLQWFG